MNRHISRISAVVTLMATSGFCCIAALGQIGQNPTRDDAVLIVDGVVREVFRSQRQGRVDFLVEIDVTRTRAERVPQTPPRVATPSPGELVYVHASQRAADGPGRALSGQNEPPGEVRQVVPAERSS